MTPPAHTHPAPGGESVGLGAQHRHGTGQNRMHRDPAPLSSVPPAARGAVRPGGLSTAGGVQGPGCSPMVRVAVAMRSHPEHPRVLRGAVRQGHPGNRHRGQPGSCGACVGPGAPVRPRGSSGSRPGLAPFSRHGSLRPCCLPRSSRAVGQEQAPAVGVRVFGVLFFKKKKKLLLSFCFSYLFLFFLFVFCFSFCFSGVFFFFSRLEPPPFSCPGLCSSVRPRGSFAGVEAVSSSVLLGWCRGTGPVPEGCPCRAVIPWVPDLHRR